MTEYLRQIYIPNFVVKTYSKIDRRALIDMLNFKSEQDLSNTLSTNFIVEGTQFVTLRPKINEAAVFNLTAEKVGRLTHVV